MINNLSLKDQRVVVSKDTDFYYSHLLHQKPWKLLLVRTGNMSTRDLKRLLQAHLPAIVQSLAWISTGANSPNNDRQDRAIVRLAPHFH